MCGITSSHKEMIEFQDMKVNITFVVLVNHVFSPIVSDMCPSYLQKQTEELLTLPNRGIKFKFL